MIDAAGNEQSQEILGSAPLTKGVSYYLVARCVLQDHMHEDEPNDRQTNRWQLWQLDARIWSFNLDTGQWNGPAPLDEELNREDLQRAKDRLDDINRLGLAGHFSNIFHVAPVNRTNSQIGLRQSEVMASIGCMSAEGDTADGGPQG
ncbi:hypothetical protein C2W62_01055 [Candidatus Entotheonella serta]|nr:hypothetical protein C2W62_01055 [Candidatus Entotheonella serta]